ncbi:hypothetical protein [uncultured Mycolicibacterium sp.]|uniref:hypothetical protein n=1 Tax=uncultured Mycolicibacterium sp. TaxID=2320817 RepID=UPI00262D1567|nr:hypothetical protein [uncultured Mycolicibacterium sp.]
MRALPLLLTAALAAAAGALPIPAPAPARAQPAPTVTQVPEQPPAPARDVTDDPGILDPRPQPVEAFSRGPGPDEVTLYFTTGIPECVGAHAEVQETPDLVAVKLWTGPRAAAADRACIEISVTGRMPVRLATPLGRRAVVNIT